MYAKLNAKQQAKASAASRRAPVYSLHAMLGGFDKSEIRCFEPGTPIFARATLEYPGAFAHWEFHPAGGEEGVVTIKNVGLGLFVVADDAGRLFVSYGPGAEFRVQPADDGFVQIKQSNADKVWGLKGDSPVYGEVVLQSANGSDTQKFSQVPASDQ